MTIRITKEIAQERLNEKFGEKFKFIEWNGTAKPATIECSVCGEQIQFKIGQTSYIRSNRFGFNGECNVCKRYEYAFKNIQNYEKYIVRYKELIKERPMNKEIYEYKIQENEKRIEREKNIIREYLDKVNMLEGVNEICQTV